MGAKERLFKAMEHCLETMPIDNIKIGDLTSAADVSRQTFYRLYEDKYQLLKDFYQKTIEDLYVDVFTPADMHEATYRTLLYFKDHPDITRNMFFSKDAFALKEYFRNLCCDANAAFWRAQGVDVDDVRIMGALQLYSYGTASFLMGWIKDGMPGDPKVVAEQFSLAYPIGAVQASGLPLPLELYAE